MQVFLGIPCPSCGMTTSFSHFVRGQWPSAFLVNPAGFLLAAACLAAIPWAGWLAFSGRYPHVFAPMEVFLWTAGAVTIVSFVQWLIRILVS